MVKITVQEMTTPSPAPGIERGIIQNQDTKDFQIKEISNVACGWDRIWDEIILPFKYSTINFIYQDIFVTSQTNKTLINFLPRLITVLPDHNIFLKVDQISWSGDNYLFYITEVVENFVQASGNSLLQIYEAPCPMTNILCPSRGHRGQ